MGVQRADRGCSRRDTRHRFCREFEAFAYKGHEGCIDQSLDRSIELVDNIAAIGGAATGENKRRMQVTARRQDHLQAGHAADIDRPARVFFDRLGARLPPERITQQRRRFFFKHSRCHFWRFPLTEIRKTSDKGMGKISRTCILVYEIR